MEAYTSFAEVYDKFMDNVPYSQWAEYLDSLLQEYQVPRGLLLELGCGTGSMAEEMAARGYDLIGVDASEDMLAEALEKKYQSGHDILYLCQDMRSFELYGTVAAAFCVCDSLNYLTQYPDLVRMFRLVNNYLDPGGVFVFDCNTAAEYRSPLRQSPMVETQDGDTLIWENFWDEAARENGHRLTLFLQEADGRYRKEEEAHLQKAWEPEEIRRALEEAGLTLAAVYEAFTRRPPAEDSARLYFIAKENGK